MLSDCIVLDSGRSCLFRSLHLSCKYNVSDAAASDLCITNPLSRSVSGRLDRVRFCYPNDTLSMQGSTVARQYSQKRRSVLLVPLHPSGQSSPVPGYSRRPDTGSNFACILSSTISITASVSWHRVSEIPVLFRTYACLRDFEKAIWTVERGDFFKTAFVASNSVTVLAKVQA